MSLDVKKWFRFSMGQLTITAAAQATLDAAGVSSILLLARHFRGDWGDLCNEDLVANELALRTGKRLHSSYDLPACTKVWVITEADRSVTILLPDEY